jgi:phosphatidylglycerophosphatase A
MKPGLRFLVSHPAHALALGFGSGLPPRAPGTFGTVFGLIVFLLIDPWIERTVGMAGWIAILVVGFAFGCWACLKTGRDLGAADHGAMVWDEIIAIWLVLLFTPPGWSWAVTSFALFRFFDIVKPAPIRRFERRFKSNAWAGFGVMGDDLIAAFYALLALAVVVRIVQWIT